MARNAFALVLLTAIALGGCSTIKGALKGDKDEKAAAAKLAALRARTDSLRKARRLADSLAQVRYTVCADSVRLEISKPAAAKGKTKKKKKAAKLVKPSAELIATQVQAVCGDAGVPQTTIASADTARAKAAPADTARPAAATRADSIKADKAANQAKAPAPVAVEQPAAPATAAPAATVAQAVRDSAPADSAQKKSTEMDLSRETFAYSGAARDPFNSLLNMAKTGPELADLQLVGVYHNLRAPSATVAVFREKDGGKRHKLRVGDQVGRSRLVQIREREVVFIVEDFGFERQETLSLRKQEDVTP